MGGAVSSGRDNDELVDNLMNGNYIRSRAVERVFRVLDRADYMCAEARDQAYKDLAWRNGPLHLSAPCIYSKVMEALELKPGLSFLNVGSGTGYLSTLVGLIIGSSGISHGVEALPVVLEYANKKLTQFMENSNALDEFDFCIPKYFIGNGLCLAPHRYDRVYCGAGVLVKYSNYFKQLLKVGGVLVMPLADTLVQTRRVSETQWQSANLLNVSFARLRDPSRDELDDPLSLDEQTPPPLQVLCRAAVRARLRGALESRQPELREPEPAGARAAPRPGPRRICIPLDANSDEELNELHGLDGAGGAHEMNALLSLVLTMGQNRAAGSLRFDHDYDPQAEPTLGERSGEEDEAEDDIIVFDVGIRAAMRASRRARARDLRRADRSDSSADTSNPLPERRAPAAARSDPPSEPAADQAAPGASAGPSEPATEPSCSGTARSAPSADHTSSSSEPSGPSSERSAKDLHKKRRRSTDLTSQSDVDSPAEPSAAVTTDSQGTPDSLESEGSRGRARPAPRRAAWTDLSSSEDDALQIKDTKRQKLDSGIGEGTASSGASTDKSPEQSADRASPALSYTDDDDDADTDMPWAESECCGSSGSDSLDESEPEVAGRAPRTPPRRPRARCTAHTHCLRLEQESMRRRRARGSRRWVSGEAGGVRAGADPRRARLSLAMKRAIKELPLPPALKSFLNYGRCYQI